MKTALIFVWHFLVVLLVLAVIAAGVGLWHGADFYYGETDAARTAGADGMIYTARSEPTRWHLVLFRWNTNGPILAPDGPAEPFSSGHFSSF